MKKQNENIEEYEMSKPFLEEKSFNDPKDSDIPKPDGETVSSNEEEDENDKPGENIFK